MCWPPLFLQGFHSEEETQSYRFPSVTKLKDHKVGAGEGGGIKNMVPSTIQFAELRTFWVTDLWGLRKLSLSNRHQEKAFHRRRPRNALNECWWSSGDFENTESKQGPCPSSSRGYCSASEKQPRAGAGRMLPARVQLCLPQRDKSEVGTCHRLSSTKQHSANSL